MNAITHQIIEEMRSMPPTMQHDVLDFVRYLKTKSNCLEALVPEQAANDDKGFEEKTVLAAKVLLRKENKDWLKDFRHEHPLTTKQYPRKQHLFW
jgi:hypothetical protein